MSQLHLANDVSPNLPSSQPPLENLFPSLGSNFDSVEWTEVVLASAVSRQSAMENKLQWNTTFDGRQPLIEDNLQWKRTFNGKQP